MRGNYPEAAASSQQQIEAITFDAADKIRTVIMAEMTELEPHLPTFQIALANAQELERFDRSELLPHLERLAYPLRTDVPGLLLDESTTNYWPHYWAVALLPQGLYLCKGELANAPASEELMTTPSWQSAENRHELWLIYGAQAAQALQMVRAGVTSQTSREELTYIRKVV